MVIKSKIMRKLKNGTCVRERGVNYTHANFHKDMSIFVSFITLYGKEDIIIFYLHCMGVLYIVEGNYLHIWHAGEILSQKHVLFM